MGARADGLLACAVAEMQAATDRFHVSQRGFTKDSEWSQLMEDSARYGVSILDEDPEIQFESYANQIAEKTRSSLRRRSSRFSEGSDSDVGTHATHFGVIREISGNEVSLFDYFPDKVTQQKAVEYSEHYGIARESAYPGVDARKLQISYEGPHGPIQLSGVRTTRSGERIVDIEIVITPRSSVAPAFQAMDGVFQRLKQLKRSLDLGRLAKNEKTLEQVKNEVSEIYWLLSQAWPYYRGSASMADLATRSILDWLGIENAPWSAGTNANLVALISPLAEFKQDYNSLLQAPLKWKGDGKR